MFGVEAGECFSDHCIALRIEGGSDEQDTGVGNAADWSEPRPRSKVLIVPRDEAAASGNRVGQLFLVIDSTMPQLLGTGDIDAQAAGDDGDLLREVLVQIEAHQRSMATAPGTSNRAPVLP